MTHSTEDDIVTRPEQEIDFVEYLRLWASPDGNDQAVLDLHKAADEIERLRAEVEDLKMWADNYRVLAARLTAIVQKDLNN